MRVLYTADVHAGIVTHSRTDPASGLPSALEATLRSFAAVVDIALERKVDAVIIAGDLYHSPNPTAAAIIGVDAQLDRLDEGRIPTLLYPGNHDRAPHPGQRSILAVHNRGSISVVEEDEVVDLGELRVGVLPSFPRSRFGNVSREEAERFTVDYLERALGTMAEEFETDIVTGHWPISGSLLGGEVDVAIIAEPMLSPAELEGPWRYAAMGHIHRAQAIRSGLKVVGGFSGSIDRFNFGEESYVPTASIIDVGDPPGDIPTVEEIALPARTFRTINLERDEIAELSTPDLLAANEGGIIRIRGRFAEGEPYRQATAAAAAMRGVLYDSGASIVYLEVEPIRESRVRVADITEAPTELEALERWIQANEIEDDVADGLRKFAAGLLEETSRR